LTNNSNSSLTDSYVDKVVDDNSVNNVRLKTNKNHLASNLTLNNNYNKNKNDTSKNNNTQKINSTVSESGSS